MPATYSLQSRLASSVQFTDNISITGDMDCKAATNEEARMKQIKIKFGGKFSPPCQPMAVAQVYLSLV